MPVNQYTGGNTLLAAQNPESNYLSGLGIIQSPMHGNMAQANYTPNPLPEHAMALNLYQPVEHRVPEFIRNQRSAMLNKLTEGPNMPPTLAMAMSPAYFPFEETARKAHPDQHGVVKLKNVRPSDGLVPL
jgi:hypothetical protein